LHIWFDNGHVDGNSHAPSVILAKSCHEKNKSLIASISTGDAKTTRAAELETACASAAAKKRILPQEYSRLGGGQKP